MREDGRPDMRYPHAPAPGVNPGAGGRPAFGMGHPQAAQAPYGAAPGMPAGAQAYAAYAHPGAYQVPATSVAPEPERKKKRGCAFWIVLALALLALAVAAVLAFMLLSPAPRADRSGDLGQLEGKTPAEIQAELDRVIEEGMFNINIASVVEFADGKSAGELRIENVPNNNYLMRVAISRADTGERIYQTDIIEPNHHIQSDTLDVDLDPGSYECTATFTALDPETEQEAGEVAAAMTINVLG